MALSSFLRKFYDEHSSYHYCFYSVDVDDIDCVDGNCVVASLGMRVAVEVVPVVVVMAVALIGLVSILFAIVVDQMAI